MYLSIRRVALVDTPVPEPPGMTNGGYAEGAAIVLMRTRYRLRSPAFRD